MPKRLGLPSQEGEARFRHIIEENADAILIITKDGAVRYANAAAERLLAQPGRELIDALLGIPLAPGDTVEVDLPNSEGEARVAEMRVTETQWLDQPVWFASLRDVTERKRASEALRFLDAASQALAGSLDCQATIARVASLAVMHLADWCTIDLRDRDQVTRIAATHADSANLPVVRELQVCWKPDWEQPRGVVEVLVSGNALVLDHRCDGELPLLLGNPAQAGIIEALGCRSAMIVPLHARGRTFGALTFVSTTNLHRYGDAELTLARELAQRAALAIDNARLYEQAQTALKQRDHFLAMLSHELRNPLAAVISSVEVMHVAADSPSTLERAGEVIERQARHMANMLDDLLDISRITRGKIELRRRTLDLASVVHDAVAACRQLIFARQHELRLHLPPRPLWVDGDPTRLDQVLTNLLNNAAKYTPPSGTIELTLNEIGGQAVICISDNGIGIAEEDLPHIFDLFAQVARPLDRSEGGLGIGLTLVKQLSEMHGGTVSVHSDGLGQGSRFVLQFPLCRPPQQPVVACPHQQCGSGRRITLVEDNADSREMLSSLLELEGHSVAVAESGPDGLELIASAPPEIALIDIGLPDMDGYQLAAALKADPATARVFLIALTGYGQPEDRRRALEAGFDAHMIKPVDLAALTRLFPSGSAH